MRLWTLHPKYLDRQGLVAVWREALLDRAVLGGKTKGYTNHPQLDRFKRHPHPKMSLALYLHEVLNEAKCRGYNFDESKIEITRKPQSIQTTSGQLEYEVKHLLGKLEERSKEDYEVLAKIENFDPVRWKNYIRSKFRCNLALQSGMLDALPIHY
jgi:hypothetical protein